MGSFKENLTKAITELRENNRNMFLPFEDILRMIERDVKNDRAMQVLIPDYVEFAKICSRPVDGAQHESIVVMGIRNMDLDILLHAIRRLILDENEMLKARHQYVTDLSELNWWGQRTEADRYRVGNSFKGRIYELILASWLSEQGYDVVNMEAWDNSSPDIVAEKDGAKKNIQVKYIAQYKKDFEQDCQTYFSSRFGQIDCTSTAINLTGRINEAALQLENRTDGLRVVAIIIDNREAGSYFIEQENCCRNTTEVLRFQESLYSRNDIDEVRIFTHQGLRIKPLYEFDIKNQLFVKL